MPIERACQVIRTLDVIGEKWSLLIVRNALRGQTRYSQFRESLGAPTDILTNRLGKLVDAGVLEKRRGLGMYVTDGARERLLIDRRAAFARDFVAPLLVEARSLGLPPAEVHRLIDQEVER